MLKIFMISLTVLLVACSSSKEVSFDLIGNNKLSDSTQVIKDKSPFNLQLSIQKHHPYCGGAAPTEDMINNYTLVSGYFILINKQTGTKSKVMSNNGIIELNLEIGHYSIQETFKNISFNEFYKKYKSKDKMYRQNGSEDCFKKWWSTNLFEFDITDTTVFIKDETTIYDRCFTGNNPCVQYTGPYPP